MKKRAPIRFSLVMVVLTTLILNTSAKEKKFSIGFQPGIYYADLSKENIKSGNNIAVDLSFLISEKFEIIAHANFGKSKYYDTELSNVPLYFNNSGGTNSSMEDYQIGLMLGYIIPISKNARITTSIGIGTYTHTYIYPWGTNVFTYEFEDEEKMFGTITDKYLTETNISFPIRLSIGFNPVKNIEIAFTGGFYLEPNFPIVGLNFGPQITFKF